ncbi:hypothetical protein ACFL4P_01755 [Gemmatimonadota bacterium]
MKTFLLTTVFSAFICCSTPMRAQPEWCLSALPASIRLDPSSGKIFEDRPDLYKMDALGNLLEKNWIYNGTQVNINSARGEYVSFQLVIEKTGTETLKDIVVEVTSFSKTGHSLPAAPELFLEWAVEVKNPSTGYEKSSLGPGWYPDALIPLKFIQMDLDNHQGRLLYPFELPDFINRIYNQRYALIWVDQWVPLDREKAAPGDYEATVTVSVSGKKQALPLILHIWDFALPNENILAGNLQQEGFISSMNEQLELDVYQLFKRHRIVPADPTYDPAISITANGEVIIDFDIYDSRLRKYFTGEAFTEKYGYRDGPGYGEPIEQYLLPFDVYTKYDMPGWPSIVFDDLSPGENMERYRQAASMEREPSRQKIYLETIRQVREHILSIVDPEKTDLIVYLTGLDESYFPEAWERMAFWGKIFKDHFPEIKFRVDGSYSEEAMEEIHQAIDYWCCHTLGYDMETIEAYRKLGVTDLFYGPQLYEREENGWSGSSTFIDLELTNERLMSWACWKYRSLTWCHWGIGSCWETAWYNAETWKDYFRNHGTGPLCYRNYNGNAMWIYAPGVIPEVNVACPSVRLKAMRDGVEEYEYMRLLSQLDGNSGRVDELVNRIVFQPYGRASYGNLEAWNHNPAEWDAVRIELGKMIEEASKK